MGFPGGSMVKNPPTSIRETGDFSSIPGQEDSLGEGNGNTLQYSCLENFIKDPGGLQSTGLQRVGQNRACTHALIICYM